MPWNDQNGGGGWQGGGGGNRGPWGQGPGGGGGQQPPDLEELIRRGQEKFKNSFPGGGAMGNRGPFIIIGLAILAFLIYGSFYRVNTAEQGVVVRFGEAVRTTQPGLHMKFPYPIETVYTPNVEELNPISIGNIDDESLMLTGDENIVNVAFTVLWRIDNASDYLFNVEGPDLSVKAVAESAMREVVGQSAIQVLLTSGRVDTQQKVKDLVQATLNSYVAGIEIVEVQLQPVAPPSQVESAFRDVQAARADQERLRNVAEAYANTVIPEARGEAEQISQAASAYREQTIAEAEGQANRFLAIYNEYRNAKDVTRRRMFLETMERVFGDMNKVIIDDKASGSGVVPYLPLNELNRSSSSDKSGAQ